MLGHQIPSPSHSRRSSRTSHIPPGIRPIPGSAAVPNFRYSPSAAMHALNLNNHLTTLNSGQVQLGRKNEKFPYDDGVTASQSSVTLIRMRVLSGRIIAPLLLYLHHFLERLLSSRLRLLAQRSAMSSTSCSATISGGEKPSTSPMHRAISPFS